MIGTLGDIVFTVSSNTVRTFQQLQRSGKARYHQHDVVSTKPVLEFLGPDLDSIQLPIKLDATLGLNPLKEITAMRDYMSNGNRLALVIGGNVFGDFVIEQLDDSWDRVDGKGKLMIATVNLTLKESIDE